MTDQEITERLAALSQGDSVEGGAGYTPLSIAQTMNEDRYTAEVAAAANARPYKFVKPLIHAADSLIDYLQNVDGRYLLGLREIDIMTRGFGPGELIYLLGYTHSGKTQVILTAILNNRKAKRVVLFTADEPAELVLTKLVCMMTRSNAERMEERVRARDPEAVNKIRRIAREDLSNLIIVDQSMTKGQLSDAIKEAEDWWQDPVDLAVYDYLELFARAEGVDVEEASQLLKGWSLAHKFPTVCIHQGSRGHSGNGQELKMNAGKYGGEQEAIIQIGVRRQRDNDDLDDHERLRHENTISVSVIKNKRPPSKRGEEDYFMCPDSGLVLPLDMAPRPVASRLPSDNLPTLVPAFRQQTIGD